MLEQGAALLRQHGIVSDLDLGPLLDPETPFPGDALLRQRLQHMYDAGAWVLMESALADLPADLRWLFESGAVTLPELAAIHRATGATSASDVAAAIDAGLLRTIPGLDESKEQAIVAALPTLRASIPRVPLGRAIAIVDPIVETLAATPGIGWAMPAGSLRRGQETVGDLEIVASATDPAPAVDDLSRHPDAVRVLHRGARSIYLLFDRVQLGVRLPSPENAGSTLWRLTGSPAHVNAISRLARERGVDISHAATEEELYARVGLPFIPAEIRDGADEIAAARDLRLPTLVSRTDIRGDLHMHTSWSDGRDSVEAMVAACHALGYEYIAITDHSPRSAASRTLTPDGVSEQADEIAAMREQYPGLTIFHGCAVAVSAKTGQGLDELRDAIRFPCVVKTAVGTASRGVWLVRDDNGLEAALKELGASGAFAGEVLVQDLVVGATEKAQGVFCRGQLLGFHAYRQIAAGAAARDAVALRAFNRCDRPHHRDRIRTDALSIRKAAHFRSARHDQHQIRARQRGRTRADGRAAAERRHPETRGSRTARASGMGVRRRRIGLVAE